MEREIEKAAFVWQPWQGSGRIARATLRLSYFRCPPAST